MLKVIRKVSLKRATDPQHGNVQSFLDRLLVEVIAGNYRYFLNEHLLNAVSTVEEPEAYCWPPLLANERQVSGLFANALAAVCPISRPEFAIRRPGRPKGRSKKEVEDRNGRIDFFAYYGNRTLALELKQVSISSLGETREKKGLAAHWEQVWQQSAEAMRHLRTDKYWYPHPVSIGLLVVRVSRKVTTQKSAQEARELALAKMNDILKGIEAELRPDFLAHYAPPPEMQTFLRGTDQDERRVFPGVIFAGVVHGNQPAKLSEVRGVAQA